MDAWAVIKAAVEAGAATAAAEEAKAFLILYYICILYCLKLYVNDSS